MAYQFFHLLLHTSKITKDSGSAELSSAGIHPGQAWLLDVVSRFEPIKQVDVAAILNVKLPAVSRMVKGMEKDGLISRKRHSSDDRVILVSLTDMGRSFIPQIRESWSVVEEKMMAGFSEKEKAAFKKYLVRAADNLSS